MPGGTGRGIALGIEQGTRNFLDSFYAVKEAKFKDKYRKLAPVIQIINSQIEDPNTPLDQKIKAIDTLPSLLGIKGEIPLSVQLGLDKLAQQEVDTGETKTTEGKKKELISAASTVQMGEGETSRETPITTSVELKPTQTTKTPLLRRRGELSTSDFELMKRKQIISAQQDEEFQRQYKLALLNADLQGKVLDKQGWKNNGDWTYDPENKTWQQEWFNPITKETYSQKLTPGVVPETVILKQIQSAGKGSGGVSKAYATLRTAIATQMGLEEDDPKVQLATANLWKNNFEAGVIYKQQGVTGTRAIQPAQQEGLSLQKLQVQQKHAELVSQAEAADANVNSLFERKKGAWETATNTLNDFKKIKEDYDPDEQEYQAAQAAYNRATDDANKIESEYQAAAKSAATLKEQVQLSEKNLNSKGVSTSKATNTPELSPRMKVRIKIFRERNPNANLTDEQIANILKAQGFND